MCICVCLYACTCVYVHVCMCVYVVMEYACAFVCISHYLSLFILFLSFGGVLCFVLFLSVIFICLFVFLSVELEGWGGRRDLGRNEDSNILYEKIF